MVVGLSDGGFHEDYTLMVAEGVSKPGVIDPEKAQRQIEQGRDPRIIYDDQGNAVDYDLPTDSRMPLQAPGKPADEFKSPEGTQPPGNAPKAEIRPEPYGLNPPEGNVIQSYVKGREEAVRTLPETIRNIPEQFKKDMEASARKTPDEKMQEAIDVAMSFGTGTMVGVKARTTKAKLSDLGFAQVLESAGEHPDVIWKKTGFARGAEGRWRHEIDDSKAVFKKDWSAILEPTTFATASEAFKKQGISLDEIYGRGSSPSTYKLRKWKTDEYIDAKDLSPELKDVWESLHGRGTQYFITSAPLSKILNHPELFEAYPELKNLRVIADKNYEDAGAVFTQGTIKMGPKAAKDPGILMHEVQHWIQEYEGFARGGAPKKVGDTAKDQAAWENYRRLAGEVEANNTEARLLLTEKERREMAPWWTEDVKRRNQIVMKENAYATHEGVFDPVLKRIIK
jgi:hypothetical protein